MEHVIVDCESGETVTVPLTDEESAALAAAAEAAARAEQEAAAEDTNAATLENQAEAALAANKAWLTGGIFTTSSTLAQVKALTKQNNAVIRLLLRKLDGTE